MAQYKHTEMAQPFWAQNDGYKAGRDPMGIENSSIATYGELLPGLTNLTGHIRYYSLFCWILSEYDKYEKSGKTEIHQYNFIRRAELIIAFMMKDQNERSVVGANFISQGKYKKDSDGVYCIDDGADFDSTSKTYWKYKTGAFGQYYLGSLIYFELVKQEEGRFYLRDKGKSLAESVVKSVDKDVLQKFIECITDGGLDDGEIRTLQPLCLNSINIESDEWTALNTYLIKTDKVVFNLNSFESTLRRDTVYLMLKALKNGISVDGFVRHMFSNRDSLAKEASFGWYFYYLCEMFHYSIETIFCYILSEIDQMQNPPISSLLDKMCDDIISCFKAFDQYVTVRDWLYSCKEKDILKTFDQVDDYVCSRKYFLAAAESIMLFFRLYHEYIQVKDDVLDFESKYDLTRQRGILSVGLASYVERYFARTPIDYIRDLFKQIMNEHTVIAIAKMGNSSVDLRKFIMEEGSAILVEVRYPNMTSPRIRSLYNFLVDMGYVDRDGLLTKIANQYMDSYGN